MTTSSRRPNRWSRRTDDLVHYVASHCRPGLQSELGRWLESNSRFRLFVTAHQDKIRKKLSTTDEQARLDVRSELLVAYLMLSDRRFDLSFEAYGVRALGPDLSVTYRVNQHFNLEVTRLRATADPGIERLAGVIVAKLRQLPAEVANALLITTRGLSLDAEGIAAAVRLLKMYSDRKEHAIFVRRGLRDASEFYSRYLRLGGIVVLDEDTTPARATLFANREARHPLSREVVATLIGCLTSAP